MSFSPNALTLAGEISIGGTVDLVFSLFSPLGEKSWVPEWDPELLHPPGATWERGLVFRTKEERGDAIWIVTVLDRLNHRVEYHRVEPSRYVARIEVSCRPISNARTQVQTTYQFIGLSDEGNSEIKAMTEADYRLKMARWQNWINWHLEGST